MAGAGYICQAMSRADCLLDSVLSTDTACGIMDDEEKHKLLDELPKTEFARRHYLLVLTRKARRHQIWLAITTFLLTVLLITSTWYQLIPSSSNRHHQFKQTYLNASRWKPVETEPPDVRNLTDEYLIDTEACKLKSWPVFDEETRPLFEHHSGQKYPCDKNHGPGIFIKRVNLTWVQITLPPLSNLSSKPIYQCYAREIMRLSKGDTWDYGPVVGPLGHLNNFANNLTDAEREETESSSPRWDSVEIMCNRTTKSKVQPYTYVVPLVQYYRAKRNLTNSTNTTQNFNVILLGIDSISRLSFLRHFLLTKSLLDANNFIPLYGYHKVGENSFPNILPMFTGHQVREYWNSSMGSSSKFDHVPIIFKDFTKKGYVTTFMEDMPPYGFFTYGKGGFSKQPTNYYLRPTNLVLWKQLYYSHACYRDKLEYEIYYQYILDLFKSFKIHGGQRHFTFAHMSTLTHNYLNHAGYADLPFYNFLRDLFAKGYHNNSLIMLYSDHGLRFGSILTTRSGIYEQRLPYFYMYVPDSLRVGEMDATELREKVRFNQRRLTSHIDLHATMMHALLGHPPENEPYGRSLFTEIPTNRTCKDAGISDHYCLCNPYVPIALDKRLDKISKIMVQKTNDLLKPLHDKCAYLQFNTTLMASIRQDEMHKPKAHYLIQWKTNPGGGIFESTVLVDSSPKNSRQILNVTVIGDISRVNKYGDQAQCVKGQSVLERYCYCKKLLTTKLTSTSGSTTRQS